MLLRRPKSHRRRAGKYLSELAVSLLALRWLAGFIGRHARA